MRRLGGGDFEARLMDWVTGYHGTKSGRILDKVHEARKLETENTKRLAVYEPIDLGEAKIEFFLHQVAGRREAHRR